MKVLFLSFFIILLDQATKLLVKGFSVPFLGLNYEGMYHGQRISVSGDFFRLTFIENPGMAFGFDPGLDFKFYISLFSLVASVGLFVYIYMVRHQKLSLRIALAFILGGAVGNLIDRIFYGVIYDYAPLFYGRVVDFFDFDFFNVTIFGRSYERWPIFNIADAAVTIGVLVLIIFYKQHNQPADQSVLAAENLSPDLVTESVQNNPEPGEQEININQELPDNNKPENDQSDKGKEISL